MIDECMAGNIDMIITKSISRFAGNTLDCLQYIRKLKEKNIAVYFEKENINTLDAKGEIMLTIMASLAQQESQSLSQNVKLGYQYRYQETENLRNVYLMLFHSLCAVVWDLLTHISISGIIKRPAKLSS